MGSRFLFSANSFFDQTVDDLDGLGTDFDRFATDHVSLSQSRARLRIADHKSSVREGRRTRRGRTRSHSGGRLRGGWREVGRGRSVWFGVGNVVLGCIARSREQEGGRGGNRMAKCIGSAHDSNSVDACYLIRVAVLVKASCSSGGTARTKASRALRGAKSSPGIFARIAVAVS